MSDAEGAQDDIQVGSAAGVNDPGDISWRTTAWSAGGENVGSVKVAKRAGESFKQPSSAMSGKTITNDLQGVAIGGNGHGEGAVGGGSAAGGGVTLTAAENKKLRQQEMNQPRSPGLKKSPSQKRCHGDESGESDQKERLKRHLTVLSTH